MDERRVTIWNNDCKRESVKPVPTECAGCGMVLSHPREFHPFAACLMMEGARAKYGRGGDQVTENLNFVIDCARKAHADG